MPRPPKIVKTELSLTIAELRRRLGLSQQSLANLFSLSIGAIARWELNRRPERRLHERLYELAKRNGFHDLADVLWREYRREHGLADEAHLALELSPRLRSAIRLAARLPVPEGTQDREVLNELHETLKGLGEEIFGVLQEYDASGLARIRRQELQEERVRSEQLLKELLGREEPQAARIQPEEQQEEQQKEELKK
jgi:transcriptional regulator with XRE-family HTH domain